MSFTPGHFTRGRRTSLTDWIQDCIGPEPLCTLFRRRICLNLPRIEPRIPGRLARSVVRVLSELSRPLFVYSYIGVLAVLRWLVYWPCYGGWCNGHVTVVGVLAVLRWLVYWPCYGGWCTLRVTVVAVLAMLRWLVYWLRMEDLRNASQQRDHFSCLAK